MNQYEGSWGDDTDNSERRPVDSVLAVMMNRDYYKMLTLIHSPSSVRTEKILFCDCCHLLEDNASLCSISTAQGYKV